MRDAEHWLFWLGAFLIAIGMLTIDAALKERRLWREDTFMASEDDDLFADAGRKYGWILLLIMVALVVTAQLVWARDLGQWEETTPEVRSWYRTLMQPDNQAVSCCGEADAYFADVKVRDGKTYAVIVDDRPDEPRRRPHIAVGTEIEVPDRKLKYDAGNPTGHAVIFLSAAGAVYCFVQGTGI